MRKGGQKNKPVSDADKFQKAFDSLQKQLPKEYFDSNKKKEDPTAKLVKKSNEINALKKGNVETVIKSTGTNKHEPKITNMTKLLETDVKIKEIPKEISLQVQQARKDAELTQDQLAKKIEVKISAIKDLESGTGAYDAGLVVKIEKALNKKFDRSWKNKEEGK